MVLPKLSLGIANIIFRFKQRLVFWQRLTKSQQISLLSILFLILILPIATIVVLGPTRFSPKAEVPVTVPITPPTANTLNFKIKFQGISSAKLNRQVRVTLKYGPIYNYVNVASDTNGIYSGTITNIPNGTYDVLIKGFVHLQENLGSVTFGQSQVINRNWSAIELKAGDIDGNNSINAIDIARVVEDYFPNSPANSPADFNLDGTVNAIDIGFLIGNYFQIGDY
ncbi:MAG: dockerin type I domain-containing protein [Candidatus Gottesmanbacteria bacterium]